MLNIKQKPEDFQVTEVIKLDEDPNGDYFYYLLTKEDRNLVPVINELAKKLDIPRKSISFAGTKDKIAVTSQWISIYKADTKKVSRLKTRIKGVTFSKEFKRGTKPINLGDLEGNKFLIKIDFKPKKLDSIINYFGPQRFSKNNDKVGKLILQKKFVDAANLIEAWKVEEYIKNNPTDGVGALRKLDRKILSLYINSYQSYLWNKVAEKFKDKDIIIPILSFETKFKDKKVEETYDEILKNEGLSKRDFIIKQLPDVTPISSKRSSRIKVRDFEYNPLPSNNEGYIKFFLPKGSYATVALEQMQ